MCFFQGGLSQYVIYLRLLLSVVNQGELVQIFAQLAAIDGVQASRLLGEHVNEAVGFIFPCLLLSVGILPAF